MVVLSAIIEILSVFILTFFIYLAVPFTYFFKKGKVSKKKGKKIALLNAIICAFICVFIGVDVIGLKPSENGIMSAPALLYYYISKAILIDKNMEDENAETPKESNDNPNAQNELPSPWDFMDHGTETTPHHRPSPPTLPSPWDVMNTDEQEDIPAVSESDQDECGFHLCSKCGMQVFDDQNFCPMCGEKNTRK